MKGAQTKPEKFTSVQVVCTVVKYPGVEKQYYFTGARSTKGGAILTQNQIAYWSLQEQKRSNQVKEQETQRSNQAREAESVRSNLRQEQLKDSLQKQQAQRWKLQNAADAVNTVGNLIRVVTGAFGGNDAKGISQLLTTGGVL